MAGKKVTSLSYGPACHFSPAQVSVGGVGMARPPELTGL
jgi:hypothetical protein